MRYRTIVVDPPWPIKISRPPQTNRLRNLRDPSTFPYNMLSLDEIRRLPINDIAEDECQLFLWVTTGKIEGRPVIQIGFNLLEHWGFKYHQMLSWVKNNDIPLRSPIRSKTEHVLYGYRGKLWRNKLGVMANVFNAPIGRHSEKPALFYRMLARWTPEPRIDLFARQYHPGFHGWGDEYEGQPKTLAEIFT